MSAVSDREINLAVRSAAAAASNDVRQQPIVLSNVNVVPMSLTNKISCLLSTRPFQLHYS